ncbi:MAG: hypothetical protein V4722_13140 [Bacteroidota bacterium]
MKSIRFLLIVTILGFSNIAASQPGSLDQSFGSHGKVVENHGFSNIENNATVLQADGKALLLANAVYNGVEKTVILRYLANGMPDGSFGSNGKVIIFGGDSVKNGGMMIRIQSDGKILVSGTLKQTVYKPFLFRIHANGSTDSSFNGNGRVVFNEPDASTCTGFVVLPNNSTVAVLQYTGKYYAGIDFIFYKLTVNGTPDNSFGPAGKFVLNIPDLEDGQVFKLKALERQTDGKIIIAGDEWTSRCVALRCQANGRLDSTFGTNGLVTFTPNPIDGSSRTCTGMVLQTDGKPVLATYAYSDTGFLYAQVIRLTTNGTVDNSFINLEIGAYNGYRFTGRIALQPDGNIVMAGSRGGLNTDYNFALIRFTNDGGLDLNFCPTFFCFDREFPLTNGHDIATVPCIQADGKILISGMYNNGSHDMIAVTRCSSVGEHDINYGTQGKTITEIGLGADYDLPIATLIQPDQRILNVRAYGAGSSMGVVISRHLQSGSPDSTFGMNGLTALPMIADVKKGEIFRQTNGKLLAAVVLNTLYEGNRAMLIQLNDNGVIDSSFGIYGKVVVPLAPERFMEIDKIAFDTLTGKSYLSYHKPSHSSSPDSFWLSRLHADGSLDNTFNAGRILMKASAKKIVVQPDGKIICGGIDDLFNGSDFFIRRYNTNGTIDATFNNGNLVNTGFYNDPGYEYVLLMLQPDGKMLANDSYSSVSRYNSDGTIDNSFGQNGTIDYSADDPDYAVMQVQPDGKILMAGSSPIEINNEYFTRFLVKRMLGNGSTDSSFGINGQRIFDIRQGVLDTWTNMAIQADGKIITAGTADFIDYYAAEEFGYNFDNRRMKFVMARFNNSGLPSGRYEFTGSGNWNLAGNWLNNTMPPFPLPNGSEIIINPSSGSCILNVPYTVEAGGNIIVKTGKIFEIQGNLTLH